jgi:excisionase family DNA binding protein
VGSGYAGAGAGAGAGGASFYSTAEVAAHLGVGTRRVQQMILAGSIPAEKLGRRFRVPRVRWDAMRGLSAGAISLADQGGAAGFALAAALPRAETAAYLAALARQAHAQAAAWAEEAAQATANLRETERLWRELADQLERLRPVDGDGAGAVA